MLASAGVQVPAKAAAVLADSNLSVPELTELRADVVTVPDDIRQGIQLCADLARLEAWGDRAVTANSLDEIFTA